MRPKWLRDDYRERTLARAIESCRDFYDWTTGSERPVLAPPPKNGKPAATPREGERLRVTTFDAIRARPVEWLVDGLIPKRRTTILYGEEASEKGCGGR